MYQERVHLYTYDIFAEKIGFKLLWGCICFYPYFYAIGGLVFLENRKGMEDVSGIVAVLSVVGFFVGWIFTRGGKKFTERNSNLTF